MSLLVGKKAPEFNTKAVVNGKDSDDSFNLAQFQGRYVVLFFYPKDFTFVCPTELHTLQEKLPDFESKNTQVIGCSVDSIDSHVKWLSTPKSQAGIQGVTYPVLSDTSKAISESYDVLTDEGITYRGTFLIDREGIVRHQSINDLGLGRNIDETLRIVDALQFNEAHGEVCPANWNRGDKAMVPSQEGVLEYYK